MPSNGVFSGGDVDTVNLQNGNLHISIPIETSVQRGGTTLKWAFVFDTQAWIKQWIPYQCSGRCIPPGYYVAGFNTNVASNWRATNPFNWGISYTSSGILNCTNGNGQTYEDKTNWMIVDPEGTRHALPLRQEQGTYACFGQTLAGPALDGSGLYYNSQTHIIYTKDGYEIGNTLTNQDRNGNIITPAGDTVDRNLVTEYDGTTGSGEPYTTYTINDSAGNPLVYRVDYQAVTITSDICAVTGGGCTDSSLAYDLPSMLTLPTGKTYVFKYANNTPGDLIEMDLPTGAVITYQYEDLYVEKYIGHGTEPTYVGGRAVTNRTVTVNGQAYPWTYTPNLAGVNTVTDPLGNQQVHTFSTVSASTGGSQYVTSSNEYETSVVYYNSQHQRLRTINNTYAADWDPVNNTTANVRVTQTQTILDNNQTSEVQTDYETFSYPCIYYNGGACTGTGSRLNPTEMREYDYGSGAPGGLLRRTDYTYLHTNNQSYINLNIVDKPATITIYDGSGNKAAQTINEYDNYSHTGQTMQPSGAIQHNASFGTGYTTRGNLTAVSKWRNTDGATITSTNQYDDAGSLLSTIDPGGHKTSYNYTDSWAGSACVPSGTAAIFPTMVTNAKGQSTSTKYYACTGTTASTTDLNVNQTTYTYDSFDRPWQILYPDGGMKTFCYSDDPNGACYNTGSLYSTETDAISGSTNLVKTTLYDGLGRADETQLNTDPGGAVYADTQYDADGRVLKTSNPYRSGDTEYWTTQLYDGLSRSAGVQDQDGSSTSITYSGNTTLSTDEAGNQRKSQTDALGRVTSVWEAPSGVNYETDYQYDILGNLLKATQKGGDPNSANWRVRTFTYNSLSELLCSANPEITSSTAGAVATCPTIDTGSYIPGTIRYNYNNDGELTSKITPLHNQQASATVTASYSYEQLHRATNITYTDATPSVSYIYDNDAVTACTPPSLAATNPVGNMKAMCDSSGATDWSYDKMNRTLTEERTIGTATDQIGYTYYLNGAVNTVTYPKAGAASPYVVIYNENAAARIDKATGSDGVVYAQVNSTWASGAPDTWQLGANIALADTYNSRLQPLKSTATQTSPSNTLFSRTYNFHLGSGDNGNLYAVQDGLDTLGLDRPNGSVTYTYDAQNRLNSAATTGTNFTVMDGGTKDWASSYTVDPWGNLTAKTSTLCQGETMAPTTASTHNQLSSAGYDSAGNLYQLAGGGYTYDAEGRLINGMGTAYTYDGMSERVAKTGAKLYWKGVGSTALAETNTSDTSPTMYIFFNGARIARIDPGATAKYYVMDNIGSTAVETDSSGNQLNASLFFPYGVERIIQQSDTANNYKFTGKERDEETGLDDFGARYYDSSLGRFMTPDWAAKPVTVPYASFGDPQTLNLYSYVENGPLNRVDADGHANAPSAGTMPVYAGMFSTCAGVMGCDQTLPDPTAPSADELAYEAQIQQASASTGNTAAQPAQQQAQAQQQSVAAQCPRCGDMNSAAVAAEKAALPLTQASVDAKDYHEYGGYILESKSNPDQFTYSKPLAGTERQVDIDNIRAPKGYKVVGEYHTHPRGPGDNLEGFSTRDGNRYNANGRVGYVADNNTRRMYVFVPGVTVNHPDWERTGDFVQKIP